MLELINLFSEKRILFLNECYLNVEVKHIININRKSCLQSENMSFISLGLLQVIWGCLMQKEEIDESFFFFFWLLYLDVTSRKEK